MLRGTCNAGIVCLESLRNLSMKYELLKTKFSTPALTKLAMLKRLTKQIVRASPWLKNEVAYLK